jgi:hypothetical protein
MTDDQHLGYAKRVRQRTSFFPFPNNATIQE